MNKVHHPPFAARVPLEANTELVRNEPDADCVRRRLRCRGSDNRNDVRSCAPACALDAFSGKAHWKLKLFGVTLL